MKEHLPTVKAKYAHFYAKTRVLPAIITLRRMK